MPILCALFSAVGVLGGWLIAVVMIGVDPGLFGDRCLVALISAKMS